MASKKQQKVISWKIRKLKVHPRQADLVGDIPEAQLVGLTEDLRVHGLQHPIEIVTDGTIVAGHQRVLAAKRLRWNEIDVVIRNDLVEAGAAAIEQYLVRDNLVRRQLSPLGIARSMQFLMESRLNVRSGGLSPEKKEKLRAEIGRLLGKSGRTVSRHLLVLQTPTAVQAAFDREEVALIPAGRVALLALDTQKLIAARIGSGEPAKKVVTAFVTARFRPRPDVGRALSRLVASLRRELPLITGQTQEVDADQIRASLAVLQNAIALLVELVKRAKAKAA